MKLLITVTIAALLFCGSRAFAIVLAPRDEPSAPPPTAAEIEDQRTSEQSSAPREPLYNSPQNTSPNPSATPSQSVLAAPVNAFAGAMAVHHAGTAAAAQPPASTEKGGRTRGIIMMIAGLTGMAGLGFGRVLMNALSRSTHLQAEQALEAAEAQPENAREYGGDRREYIID